MHTWTLENIATLRRSTTDALLMTKLGFFLQKKLKEASFSQACLKESPRNTKKPWAEKIQRDQKETPTKRVILVGLKRKVTK